jgi:thiamine-monophosphate kinase
LGGGALKGFSERSLLLQIKKRFGGPRFNCSPLLIQGIGDDAAIFRGEKGLLWLASSDVQVEGRHFDLKWMNWEELGARAFHVAVSDIAAMGGTPRFVLLSLIIPPRVSQNDVEKIMASFTQEATKEKVQLIGGNLSGAKSQLSLDVFVIGQVEGKRYVLRSGARPGDFIYTTGILGQAAAGLEILSKFGRKKAMVFSSEIKKLVSRWLRPKAKCAIGRALAESGIVSSMMDLSDGLSSDLKTLCVESGVGAKIFCERLPISRGVVSAGKLLHRDPKDWVLHGGEDYELLFTIKANAANAKIEALANRIKTPIFEIGKITSRKTLWMDEAGKINKLESGGWDHFAKG